MRNWSSSDLLSFACSSRNVGGIELRKTSGWVLFHKGFSGLELLTAIERNSSLVKYIVDSYGLSTFFHIEISRIINWARKLDQQACYQIERIDFSPRIGSYISSEQKQNIISSFKESIKLWNDKIKEESTRQEKLLKGYFKRVFLPDRIEGFERKDYSGWTNHFDSFRYPENKGTSLREALACNHRVGIDEEQFSSILLVDISTSGKTYSIFNLAQSSTTEVDGFFVVYLYPNDRLYDALIHSLYEVSAEVAVGLFCLANHIVLDILFQNDSCLNPLEYFK